MAVLPMLFCVELQQKRWLNGFNLTKEETKNEKGREKDRRENSGQSLPTSCNKEINTSSSRKCVFRALTANLVTKVLGNYLRNPKGAVSSKKNVFSTCVRFTVESTILTLSRYLEKPQLCSILACAEWVWGPNQLHFRFERGTPRSADHFRENPCFLTCSAAATWYLLPAAS